jgi:hypothetical protein
MRAVGKHKSKAARPHGGWCGFRPAGTGAGVRRIATALQHAPLRGTTGLARAKHGSIRPSDARGGVSRDRRASAVAIRNRRPTRGDPSR